MGHRFWTIEKRINEDEWLGAEVQIESIEDFVQFEIVGKTTANDVIEVDDVIIYNGTCGKPGKKQLFNTLITRVLLSKE